MKLLFIFAKMPKMIAKLFFPHYLCSAGTANRHFCAVRTKLAIYFALSEKIPVPFSTNKQFFLKTTHLFCL